VKQAADAAKDAAEAAAEQLALDIAAKAFCRIAVPALLAPLELVEDLIPIVGKFPVDLKGACFVLLKRLTHLHSSFIQVG
jgi:hypothetical protein